MSSKVFLLLFARLLISSLFVWDGGVRLPNSGGTARYDRRPLARCSAANGASTNKSRFLLRKTF